MSQLPVGRHTLIGAKLRAFRLNGQLRVPEEAIEELLTPVDAPAESDGGEP
jgi:hypothetical protein